MDRVMVCVLVLVCVPFLGLGLQKCALVLLRVHVHVCTCACRNGVFAGNIRVYCRVRPLRADEGTSAVAINGDEIALVTCVSSSFSRSLALFRGLCLSILCNPMCSHL